MGQSPSMHSNDPVLEQQIAYYRARAGEYDQWFFRQGRYDRGAAHRAEWLAEIDSIRTALSAEVRDRNVLELACGTGLWTEQLARENRSVLAVDASPEAIAINQQRVRASNVRYQVADIFTWAPAARFDVVFFAFWLSHVPLEQFDRFWDKVRSALNPGGRVIFVDSLLEQTSTATDHAPVDDTGIARRKLNDGREFDIVKVFYEPQALAQRLSKLGWHAPGSTEVEPYNRHAPGSTEVEPHNRHAPGSAEVEPYNRHAPGSTEVEPYNRHAPGSTEVETYNFVRSSGKFFLFGSAAITGG